ncbi:MAG: type IV pilus twitching motility protein PilT [Armatimonadota bacterium]|nr:MAG: type IV pilus twitching motility protein PilT [Armatimonadota bacterium]
MSDRYPVPLDDLLKLLVRHEGSDMHLRAYEPPVFRIHGDLRRTNFPVLQPEQIKAIVYEIMGPERIARYERDLECDLAYAIKGLARFRVNVFRQQNSVGVVMRLIPIRVQTIDELGLPPVLKEVAMLPRGLVLVTGPTGSGKSTTLAAVINHINESKPVHIITIEDPIEFMHSDKVAALNQREVEMDTRTFADALRHVMRQNPDVILVGEMRDNETMQLAITAAETGHLVFSTVHTTDAAQTIDRIVDVFEPERQEQIRMQLAVTLQAVISMTLMPRADRPGRVPAFEVMLATPAIRNLIRERKTHQIYGMIQTGAELGMQTLDNHLLDLYRNGIVSFEMALSKSSNPSEFAARVGGGQRSEELMTAPPGEV